MYQWVRDYGKNPTYMPSVGSVGRKSALKIFHNGYANYAKAGSYRLPKNSLINFQKKKKLDLVDDGWFTESEIKPPYTIDHLNTNVYDNYLYTGDPLNPQVGDIRISFYGSASTHATVIGVQKSRLLNTMFGIDSVNIMKQNIILISEDNKIMINKTKDFIHRNYGNIKSLWLFRIITYLFLSGQIFSLLANSSKVAKYTHVPIRTYLFERTYSNVPIRTYLFERTYSNNIPWRLSVSFIVSAIALSLFPCIFWLFCDTAVFLFLLVFIFFLSITLLFLCNNEMDNGYTEMKNYMKRANTEPTNYTFLNIANRCTDIYEEYNNNEENKINTILDSSSDVSFYNPIHKNDGAKFESSPAGLYHHS
ncbi:conserved Plasmodium protein, unknown function [Plasmodium ovale wallikeri]|uniref:Uncharacterized protein n=1 Tax=Plasmodium ovale wallikeri TaxID=864142 RepID=A0A1A8ZE04_PLAOA|nr:conserved Plasmodium protein, unknown function [Plasmodium ovale wallikeri]